MAKTLQIRNGDIVENALSGRPRLIEGSAKLRQDVGEMLAVDEQTDGFGAGIRQLIGTINESEFGDVPLLLSRNIRRATERMVVLQQAQRAVRTDAETLSKLSLLKATPVQGSASDYQFQAAFLSLDGDTIKRTGIISTQPTGR